uniref:Uncharacterized protein n=1 Tax=Oryza glumipatula TaxID=40148 RepID=A0A0D9YPI8_9ORYZ
MASGLVVAATDPLRAFLASAAASYDLPADLRDLASSLAARSAVPYRSLRDICPKPRDKSDELKARLDKLREMQERKEYAELVRDVAPPAKEDSPELFSSYKDQIGFGLHVVLIMFTGYLVGFVAFRALFNNSPVMNAAGGILGLVGGMLMETVLFIIRSSSKELVTSVPRPKKGALARSLATAAAAVMLPPPPAASSLRRRSSSRVAASGLRASVSASTATSSTSMAQLVAAGGGIDELRLVDERAAVAALQLLPVGGCEVEKLRAVAEAAADRAEMHDIIGRQRDNWNHLLLHSNNSLLLAASLMAALAPTAAPTVVALKASAGVLLASAAVTMAAVNKIQPSQLAEEQRNATRLWRQLERDVRATLAHAAAPATTTTKADVHDAMDRVLALDAAYPLPLLPVMLDKFPKAVEPARWWPPTKKHQQRSPTKVAATNGTACRRATSMAGNGWTQELEEEMRGILRVIKAKDENEYVSVGKLVLDVNKRLAVAGPALTGAAALAAAFIGSAGEAGAWASGAAVLGGALAAAVNTVEHGGQVGMVFELCRNVAGIYRKMQEDIEANLEEADVERRENGEVFETKVALQLGRSTSELRQFRAMASPAVKDEDIREFAGKLV